MASASREYSISSTPQLEISCASSASHLGYLILFSIDERDINSPAWLDFEERVMSFIGFNTPEAPA